MLTLPVGRKRGSPTTSTNDTSLAIDSWYARSMPCSRSDGSSTLPGRKLCERGTLYGSRTGPNTGWRDLPAN
eukprot:1104587-Rhodomonas_salina.1